MQNIVEAVMGKADPEAVEAVLHHPASPTKFECLKPVLSLFSAHCYNFSKVPIQLLDYHVSKYDLDSPFGCHFCDLRYVIAQYTVTHLHQGALVTTL